jgi:glycosyltransferase involved in cell wall biosynthesis
MSTSIPNDLNIAVILPCYNEDAVIAGVVKSFQLSLPSSHIFVIDNNSTDNTASVARKAGAIVICETMKGKGNAVRRAFSEIDADIYVMADGDGTYDATRSPELVQLILNEHLDMVVGTRHTDSEDAYRSGHRVGNMIFNLLLRLLFGEKFTDIFSGYRVFSRRFVKSFPALSAGFEIETEMSVHAIQMGLPTHEVPTDYFDRTDGTVSKLNTYRDGVRILLTMIKLLKHIRPMAMFSFISLVFVLLSLIVGMPVITDFLDTHTVPRLPSAVAAAGLMIIGAISFVTGIILDSITYLLITNKRLMYLSLQSGLSLSRLESD